MTRAVAPAVAPAVVPTVPPALTSFVVRAMAPFAVLFATPFVALASSPSLAQSAPPASATASALPAALAPAAAEAPPTIPPSSSPPPAAPPPDAASPPLDSSSLELDVLIANDPDFPPVGEAEATSILDEAVSTVSDKLGYKGLSFRVVGRTSVKQFLDDNADDACLASFESVRVRPGTRTAKSLGPKAVMTFLQRWKVDELKAFFPASDRKALTTYDAIAQKLLDEFDRKIGIIAGFTLPSGASLLAPEKADERSYVRWVCAMRAQAQADLVLTNAFILYDLGSEPYPHSIFQKCKVGGASLLSPKRRAMRGRAMVSSTFSMMTDLPFFKEDGVEDLRPQERLEVIGAFIVAHELGHALFKLPDFYDHPKECLMTTKYETGYVSGYWYLKAYPGTCAACAPWVTAKRHVFVADRTRATDVDGAIAELKQAIHDTPKHIDGSYRRYIADLSYEVAELYAQKDPAEARRWVAAVLRIVPDHADALALRDLLNAKSGAVAAPPSAPAPQSRETAGGSPR